MQTGSVIVAALLVAGAHCLPTVTLAPTHRVKGHGGDTLTLKCDDRNNTGLLQLWLTPFGDLQHSLSQRPHTLLEPVRLQQDGSLLVSNSSRVHSGLYYCLLKLRETSTLRPVLLSISNRSSIRTSTDSTVSHSHFAAAVASSVLLSFVLGFSSGALSRSLILRCLGAIAKRMQLPRQQRRLRDNVEDGGLGVVMVPVPPMVCHTSPTPPAKPQRSFRQTHTEEEGHRRVYLESCDHVKVEEVKDTEESQDGRFDGFDQSGEEAQQWTETEEVENRKGGETFDGFYVQGGERGRQTEEEEGADEEVGKEEEENGKAEGTFDGGRVQESKGESQMVEVEEEVNRKYELVRFDGFYLQGSWRESGSEKEEEQQGGGKHEEEEDGKEKEEEEEEEKKEEEEEVDGRKEEMKFSGFYLHGDEKLSRTEDDEKEEEEVERGVRGEVEEEEGEEVDPNSSSDSESSPEEAPPPDTARSARRIIRLYQYDEDGRLFTHLPGPTPSDPGHAPRLKQRSLSLTRLNAIMSTVASPLDRKEERETRRHFHMEL